MSASRSACADLVCVGVGVGDRAIDVGVDGVFDAAPVQPHHLVCELRRVGGQVGDGGVPATGERGQFGAGRADFSAVLAQSPGTVTDDLGGSLRLGQFLAPRGPNPHLEVGCLGLEGGVEVDDPLPCRQPATPGVGLLAAEPLTSGV